MLVPRQQRGGEMVWWGGWFQDWTMEALHILQRLSEGGTLAPWAEPFNVLWTAVSPPMTKSRRERISDIQALPCTQMLWFCVFKTFHS